MILSLKAVANPVTVYRFYSASFGLFQSTAWAFKSMESCAIETDIIIIVIICTVLVSQPIVPLPDATFHWDQTQQVLQCNGGVRGASSTSSLRRNAMWFGLNGNLCRQSTAFFRMQMIHPYLSILLQSFLKELRHFYMCVMECWSCFIPPCLVGL